MKKARTTTPGLDESTRTLAVSRHLAYLRKHGLVAGRKEGLWVHYRLARPRSALHRILFGCLGSCLGDPEVFAQDRQRLEGLLGCCGGP